MSFINNITQMVRNSVAELINDDTPDEDELYEKCDEYAYRAAKEGKDFWMEEAGRNLNTTRDRYQKQISIYEEFGESVVITLNEENDKLVGAIESGAEPYDLKPSFLNGRLARVIPVGAPGNTQYRTVTQAPQTAKWQHPGFPGLHLTERVDDELDDVIIPKYLEKMFKDM